MIITLFFLLRALVFRLEMLRVRNTVSASGSVIGMPTGAPVDREVWTKCDRKPLTYINIIYLKICVFLNEEKNK